MIGNIMARSSHLIFRLTARRVRLHGMLLATCLWSIYAFDMAAPGLRDRNGLIKGTDFLHFYTIGTLARTGRGDLLYNIPAQAQLIAQRFPELAGTIYVPLYPPQVSLLFAPLARLPYLSALTVWLLLNGVIYFSCCYAVWRTCTHLKADFGIALVLAAAFPGSFHLIAWGQTSGLALLCFTLAYLALRRGHRFWAGVAIGSLIFKPQLGLAGAVVFAASLEWEIIGGAVVAALGQLAIGWWYFGTGTIEAYFSAMRNVSGVLPLLEPRPYQMHSLRAFWALLVPWPTVAFGLYLLSALIVLWLTTKCWKSASPLALRYSVLLVATILISPHLTVYDLVVLAPAFLLLADAARTREGSGLGAVPGLIYLLYGLFLIGPLSAVLHLQLSVIAMAVLFWLCCQPGLLAGDKPAPT